MTYVCHKSPFETHRLDDQPVEDLETGNTFPLEVARLNVYHAKVMVELLMMSADHQEEDVEKDEPTGT